MEDYINPEVVDLYSDYLISSFGLATATGLSEVLDGAISHDTISRFLKSKALTSANLWQRVKPIARKVQSEDAVLIIDDSILEKPYSDESELVCWHWDHAQRRSVKGINLLTALYHSQDVSLPVSFELVTKPDTFIDKKTDHQKRRARVNKNERSRGMIKTTIDNNLPFKYVLSDTWYAAAENMVYIAGTLHRNFVMPLKSNRNVALSYNDQQERRFIDISSLELEAIHPVDSLSPRTRVSRTVTIWLEDVPFPLLLCKQLFTNDDGSQGTLYLVTSDRTLSSQEMAAIYHKRWKVEEYHKSLKSNASLEKSPSKTKQTQSNHIYLTLYAFVKLELLSKHTRLNHFALKSKIYVQAIKTAYAQLQLL